MAPEMFSWWQWALLGLLLVVVLAAVVWAVVVWRRKRAAAAPPRPAGPLLASRLAGLWRPFYRRIPARALHFPTVVVMGAAGVGKTHAISSHVDWRGQANQFRGSVAHDAALQLYLGPDVVVHELSAPLLRDVSRGARQALWRMWWHMGPSATVVLVLDARSLLTTPPAALHELAQLVRGKIGLFPRRCRASLEVRVLLSHLDQVDGFEAFAAVVGPDHEPLELESLTEPNHAARLVATFDGHLAYALTSRSGEEFDRLVRFYKSLRALLDGLRPLLETLQGRHEPHAMPLSVGGLYLGSLAPRTHVGLPFQISRDLISTSLGRHHQRGLRGALAVGVGGAALIASLMGWHRASIVEAEARIDKFERDVGPVKDPEVCKHQGAGAKMEPPKAEAAALQAVKQSERLWFARTFVARKRDIEERFEETFRKGYLYPKIPCSDRLQLHYLMALIYSSHANELGAIIREHRSLWEHALGLSGEVIKHYVEASSPEMGSVKPPEPPEPAAPAAREKYDNVGREWSRYLVALQEKVGQPTIDLEEAEALAKIPALLSPSDYKVLAAIRKAFDRPDLLEGRFRRLLVDEPIDLWTEEQYATLTALAEALRTHLPREGGATDASRTEGWGLGTLVSALERRPPAIPRDFTIAFDGKTVELKGSALAALFKRSMSKVLIQQVLADIPESRMNDGTAFFDETEERPRVGIVSGYGGGPSRFIRGTYTKAAYQQRIEPVLEFAAERLGPAIREPEGAALAALGMTIAEAQRLDRAIRECTQRYAVTYKRELLDYYWSMELDPATEMTLPFVLQGFSRPSGWFVEYLSVVTANASIELSEDDPYVQPLATALEVFEPLVALLATKDGTNPGLGPYQKLLAGLEPALGGAPAARDGLQLHERLTPLGLFTLHALQSPGDDPAEQVAEWLNGAGLSDDWHAPFLAPVQEVRALGIDDIESEVRRAWKDEVRPLVRPLLQAYPFSPSAEVDVDVAELEAVVRAQGKERGSFWAAFDRLLAPATKLDSGQRTMLADLQGPTGMLAMTSDLERTSRKLWDADGNPVPLKVVLKPKLLPKEPHEERFAAMSYVRSGGAAVYGFNQRPEPQTLALQWWNQGSSVVSLEMRSAVPGAGPRTYTIEEDGPFSFYRLLDRGENERTSERRLTLTAAAIGRATRCSQTQASAGKRLPVRWRVTVGEVAPTTRDVSVVLESDPWLPFAVRDCGG